MKDLDALFFTEDEFFNRNVQLWYTEFNSEKLDDYKEFIVFGNAFYDVYFAITKFDNDVIAKTKNIKPMVSTYNFTEVEFGYFITRVFLILKNEFSQPRIFFVLEKKLRDIKNMCDFDEQMKALDDLSFELNNGKSTLFAPVLVEELESTNYNERIEDLRKMLLIQNKTKEFTPKPSLSINNPTYPSIFEKELTANKFPFLDVITKEPFKSVLYKEFCDAEKKPNLTFFTRQFYSDEEVQEGLKDANSKIKPTTSKVPVAANLYSLTNFEVHLNDIKTDFYKQVSAGSLGQEFYCPSISQTPIYKILKEVEITFEILKESIFTENALAYKEAEIRSESIIYSLETLQNQTLKYAIIDNLIADNYHFLVLLSSGEKLTNEWNAVKDHFNLLLKKYLARNQKYLSINDSSAEFNLNKLKDRLAVNTEDKPVNPVIKENLKVSLVKFNFEELHLVKDLSKNNLDKLYALLKVKNLPYVIAFLDYIGFISYIKESFCRTNEKLYSQLAEILEDTPRSVKGNCLVLNPFSKENRTRYTAHLHKETVERDYQNLK